MFEDAERGHHYKVYLQHCISQFLDEETAETAFDVYRAFFDCYRLALPGKSNAFYDIVDMLYMYEKGTESLTEKQRDHYIHTINVFLTGLSIYAQNSNYRNAFSHALSVSKYRHAYSRLEEEFLYRWGIASLLHDIGYPLEIASKQIERFLNTIVSVDDDCPQIKVSIVYDHFDQINQINAVVPRDAFTNEYLQVFPEAASLDLLKPLDILSHNISRSFGTDLLATKDALDATSERMIKKGFIDHGFYSALIVLKWYGLLIQQCKYQPAYFYWPVADAATAILLHNYYGKCLQNEPFSLHAMHAEDNPIAFLLILCDELQEWNRKAFGSITKTSVQTESVQLIINDEHLKVNFITANSHLPEAFCAKKKSLLLKTLSIADLFPEGIDFENSTIDDLSILKAGLPFAPRPLYENIERLAIAIHFLYNENQLSKHPDSPLQYPTFSGLPEDLKFSNIRQAQGIYEKLTEFGFFIDVKGKEGQIMKIDGELLETMAEREHEMWVQERIKSGWQLGAKDVTKKTTPYLIPYAELSEEIKDLDREAIRNIPVLLDMINMGIYKTWRF